MKKKSLFLFLGIALTLLLSNTSALAASSTTWSSIYRLYNPNNGEHMYTLNSYERDNLKNHGWRYEGLGWQVPDNVGSPVYRLYNPNSGEHFYTLNHSESDRVKNSGWNYEGVAWNSGGGLEVYRLFNPNTHGAGSHHYTTSPDERNKLVKAGWRYEGVAWFGGDGVRISSNN